MNELMNSSQLRVFITAKSIGTENDLQKHPGHRGDINTVSEALTDDSPDSSKLKPPLILVFSQGRHRMKSASTVQPEFFIACIMKRTYGSASCLSEPT